MRELLCQGCESPGQGLGGVARRTLTLLGHARSQMSIVIFAWKDGPWTQASIQNPQMFHLSHLPSTIHPAL
jgi:hypothetical protein